MGPGATVARYLLNAEIDTFTAKAVIAETGLRPPQVYNALHYLLTIGALDKGDNPDGSQAGLFRIRDRSELARRVDGQARRIVAEPEGPPLAFFIDGDGDLQLVREGEEPVLIPNADARRLVAFVATQATAILTAGAA
jgi:hypothetical protein